MRARIILGLVASVALAVPAWAEEADAPRLPAAGTRLAARPVRAAESAVVHFGDLARADAARRAIEGALTPLVGLNERGLRAVLVCVIAERRAAERKRAH